MERIGNSNYGMIYETLAFSAIRQADIPTERLHADTTTISFYGEYDVDLSVLDETEREECIAIERGYNKDGRSQCNQVVPCIINGGFDNMPLSTDDIWC